MRANALSALGSLLALNLTMAPPNATAQESLVRSCYQGEHEFKLLQFGDAYMQDENILEKRIQGTRLLLITDNTSSHNPQRYLLSKYENRVCLILVAKQAEKITFSKSTHSDLPLKITSSTGGQSSNDVKIIYQLTDDGLEYRPTDCRLIWRLSRKQEKISCQKPFERYGAKN